MGLVITLTKDLLPAERSVRARERIIRVNPPKVDEKPSASETSKERATRIIAENAHKRYVKARCEEHSFCEARNNSTELWCLICNKEEDPHGGNFNKHLKRSLHTQNAENQKKEAIDSENMKSALKKHFSETNAKGMTLNEDTTLVHPGEHFQLEVLPKFRSDLNLLIKKSTRGKAHYLICVTVSYKKQNVTRWWITYEWYVEVSFKTFCVDSNL